MKSNGKREKKGSFSVVVKPCLFDVELKLQFEHKPH
jgi:hypothetical protein